MGRAPCCDKANVKKGPWSPEEDAKLKEYIDNHGTGGNWIALPQKVGLKRCGKSCRLRWLNYLRPNIKHGEFSDEEDRVIINLFANIGSRWSIIAAQLPGRTDNDIKNYWNTKLKKKLMGLINNNNQPNQASSTNNNNNNISYLLQPNSSSSSSSSSNNFEPNNILSSCSHMNIQIEAQESLASVMMFSSCDAKRASCDQSMVSNGIVNLTTTLGSTSSSAIDIHQSNANNNNNSVLDYGLDEIKQLINSTNSTSSCGNNFLYDEDKTDQERLLYYYY